MKKLIISLVMVLCLSGCSSQDSSDNVEVTPTPEIQETEVLSVLVPQGATALALMQTDESLATIDYVAGTDVIQASLVSADSEYDVIIAPTNLGAKLSSAGQSSYKMVAVLTWGNLFIAGNADTAMDENATIALFGDAAVPGLVYEMSKTETGINEIYYSAVSEALAQLLTGEADFALLAEPSLTAALAQNSTLEVVVDLQEAYQEVYGYYGYPQAAIFVKEDAVDNLSYELLFEEIQTNIAAYDADPSLAAAYVDVIGADVVGVPSSAIISSVYPGLNIRFEWASDVKDELETFLSTFSISDPDTYVLNFNS